MKTLDEKTFLSLVKGGTVVTINGGGVSVVLTKDNRYIKIFRPPSRFSSDLFSPRPLRFEKAVLALNARNIPTVLDLEMYWVPCMKRHAACYTPLAGEELRTAIGKTQNPNSLIHGWATFLADIHLKGVYFRGINFSNVLICPDGQFGLIDVGSVQTYKRGLDPGLRARNFKHPLAYHQDKDAIQNFGIVNLVKSYLKSAALNEQETGKFLKKLAGQHKLFANSLPDIEK